MSEDFDPSAVDYAGIEPSTDSSFRVVKGGVFDLTVADIVFETDAKQRGLLRLRYDFVDGQALEIIKEEGDDLVAPESLKPGAVWERFYFHTPKAIPMFAGWLEKMGLSWEDYKASSDKKAYVNSLQDYRFKAVIVVEEYEGRKSNKVKKYIKA